MSNTFRLLLVLLLAATIAVFLHPESGDPEPEVAASGEPGPPGQYTVTQLRDEMKARFQPEPDQRFFVALEHLPGLLGEDGEDMEVSDSGSEAFREIRLPGGERHALGQDPDFDEAVHLLGEVAADLLADGSPPPPGPHSGIEGFLPRQLLSEMENDAVHRGALEDAARSSARLAAGMDGRWWEADRFLGEALALVVAAEAVNEQALVEERAMLAEAMGYGAHARHLARKHTDGAWMDYLAHRDEPLQSAAEAGDPDAVYLWSRRLMDLEDYHRWREFTDKHFGDHPAALPVLAQGYQTRDFATASAARHAIVEGLVAIMEGEEPRAVWEVPDTTSNGHSERIADLGRELLVLITGVRIVTPAEFERLWVRSERSGGHFLSQEALADYMRSWYYNAAAREFFFILDEQDLPVRAGHFLSGMHAGTRGPAPAFTDWLGSLLEAHESRDVGTLRSGLPSAGRVGLPAIRRSLSPVWPQFVLAENEVDELLSETIQHLDARPDHVRWLGHRMLADLYHLPLAEQFLLSAGTRSADMELRLLLANRAGEGGKVAAEVFRDDGRPLEDRRHALSRLSGEHLSDREALAICGGLLEQAAHDLRLRRRCATLADERGRADQAGQWLREGIDAEVAEEHQFELKRTRIQASALAREAGDPDKGMKLMEPLADSSFGAAMDERARLHLALGNGEPARETARARARRYPRTVASHLLVAEVLWKQERYREAAGALEVLEGWLTLDRWQREVGAHLTEVLDDEASREEAFSALADHGIDAESLLYVAYAVAAELDSAGALRIYREVPLEGRMWLNILVEQGAALAEHEGAEYAADWVRQQLPDDGCGRFIPVAVYHQEHEFLWRVVDVAQCPHPEAIWLMRALSLLHPEVASARRYEQVRNAREEMEDERYRLYTGHLLGQVSAETLEKRPGSGRDGVSTAFYLGARAMAEGQAREGALWLRTALDAGAETASERRWAFRDLAVLAGRDRNLAVLAAEEGLLGTAPPEDLLH